MMEVHYDVVLDWGGRKSTPSVHHEQPSVEDFTVEQILYKEDRYSSRSRVNLEEQPKEVAKAMGRLLDLLLDKGLMTAEEFHEVIGTDYRLRKDCQIKKGN